MKEKILKLVSIVTVICLISCIFITSYVKSVQAIVSNLNNTWYGIGNTSVFTMKVNGYSNLYCANGGAPLNNGTVLNDNGVSMYNAKAVANITTNSSALSWMLDNIYLIEGVDSGTQKAMKDSLKNVIKTYNNTKDSNGKSILAKKLGVNSIDDNWINTAVEFLINDKTTLYATQQYAIWHYVKNSNSAYSNAMQNSDGSYNTMSNSKVDKKYYTALYISLTGLADQAQKNGYTSPNVNGNVNITLANAGDVKTTIQGDGKTALIGPYKLTNNNSAFNKSFSATVNSNNADKIETVDANGKAVNVSTKKDEFYVKVTYNKGFKKGTKYNFKINVKISGYKTFATLLTDAKNVNQPLISLKKEAFNTNNIAETSYLEELKGNYSLVLEKVDSRDSNIKIQGVTFKVKEDNREVKTYGPTDSNGLISVFKNKAITKEGIVEYTITEVNVENNNYIKLKDQVKFYVTLSKSNNVYVASKVSFEKEQEVTSKKVELKDGTKVNLTAKISGSTVKVTIPNKPEIFDLALRKFITKINNQDLETSREPVITAKDAYAISKYGTALYNNPKDPVKVKEGDTVIYKIRVYNEGNIDGYAKEITDYLPSGLEFIENSEINKANGWTMVKNEDGTTTVKTNKLADTVIPASNGAIGYQRLSAGLNRSDNNWVDFWKDVEIECKVKENVGKEQKLSNVAEITNYGYMDNGKYIETNTRGIDRDSEQDNVFKEKDKIQNSINDYYNTQYTNKNNNNSDNQSDNNIKNYPGRQDDDDFENLVVEPVLGEFKFVLNKVDEKGNPLIGADFTVKREKDNTEETLLDNKEVKGTYELLESEVQVNKTYTYKVIEVESAPEYVNIMEGKYVTLKVYMNEKRELVLGNFEKVEEEDYLINKYGFIINNENGTIVNENETDLYKKIKVTLKNQVSPSKVEITIPNELVQKDFDLALRKFITEIRTGVGSKEEAKQEITNRIPVFKVDKDGNYKYEHTKEPLLVANENVVVYTLRVYNEGEIDGYAKEIKDNIPEGLEFLPSYGLNEEYRWKMLDKDGKETTEVANAKYIVSDYLSKEQEKTAGESLIKAFDIEKYNAGEIKEPYYKEVKVAFKVNTDAKSEEIIINEAQISDDSDSKGNEVTDKDSVPDEWNDGEDDQDIEKVKVQYFDLALRKWVTKTIVTEDGKQVVTETGHKAEDDPEEIVKVDLNKSKISDVTVKFAYSIRVKNEGNIAGYAKEISDYIPEGLKFVKEDNPDWKEVDGKVITTKLENTLLEPGDTAEVEIILTWINSENNMGLKINTAEISKDYNEYDVPDIDSTPNNKVPGEDDIDDAPVMLTVKTGQTYIYVGVTTAVLAILASGLFLIKRYVLE